MQNRARIIEVPTDIITEDRPDELNSSKILEYLSSQGIRRGDIAHFKMMGEYRNDGRYIYNGEKLEELDRDSIDDYGAVPPSYQVINEFPNDYWVDAVDHNWYVWFDPTPYLDQIKGNLRCGKDTCTSTFLKKNDESQCIVFARSDREKLLAGGLSVWSLDNCDYGHEYGDPGDESFMPNSCLYHIMFK